MAKMSKNTVGSVIWHHRLRYQNFFEALEFVTLSSPICITFENNMMLRLCSVLTSLVSLAFCTQFLTSLRLKISSTLVASFAGEADTI